jgi:hypothetical protein
MSEKKVTLKNTFDDEAPELDEIWFQSATLFDGKKVLNHKNRDFDTLLRSTQPPTFQK